MEVVEYNFPEGVLYDRKNGTHRPVKTNFILELISRQLSIYGETKKRHKIQY